MKYYKINVLKKIPERERKSLNEMLNAMENVSELYVPSKYWKIIGKKNFDQLEKFGLENFKVQQAFSYFTFLIIEWNNWQFQEVWKKSNWIKRIRGIIVALKSTEINHYTRVKRHRWIYVLYNYLLWEYVKTFDEHNFLSIREPKVGNSVIIKLKNKHLSQDLSNSVLETYSILEAQEKVHNEIHTILELGGGYGRNAYILKHAFPKAKIIIVDIPPALLIAQWYLPKVFPQSRIQRFSDFKKFEDIKNNFLESDFIFLLPHQLEFLVNKSIDLFININSFQEMKVNQIENYFNQVNRLTSGIFYFKEWKVAQNYMDKMFITEYEYPVNKKWKKIFHRNARVQTKFFEAAYKI